MKRFGFILVGAGAGLAVVAIVVALNFFMSRSGADAAPDLETSAPAIPVAAALEEASGPPSAPAAPAAPVESHFVVDPAQSTAKLFVTETILFSDSIVTATATNVTGDMSLMPDGTLGSARSAIQLDLRTFKSSDSFLDSFLKGDTFKPFPTAEFVMTSTSGIPATYTDGNEFSFTVSGPMTMRGITKEVTFAAKGRQSGAYLSVVADTDFLMTDFGITPPNYGLGKAKNQVHLQVLFIALKAE